MAKIGPTGRVMERSKSGNNGPLIMGLTVCVESFEHDEEGRPYVKGFIENEGKMQGEPCVLYMQDLEKDCKIADRASEAFRNGAKKSREDAKMKPCGPGAILYTDSGEVSKNKEGVYVIKAKYLDTVSTGPSETAKPVYMKVQDYGESKAAFIFSRDQVDAEFRGSPEAAANLIADKLDNMSAEAANQTVFMVRNIADGAADNIFYLGTYNGEAKRQYTSDEIIDAFNKLAEKEEFDTGEKAVYSVIVGDRYSVSTLMEEGRVHALVTAFKELVKATPVISADGIFLNGAHVNGPVRVNPNTGKGYPSSRVDPRTLGSKELPELKVTAATAEIKEAASSEMAPPPPEAPAAEEGVDPLSSRGPRAR